MPERRGALQLAPQISASSILIDKNSTGISSNSAPEDEASAANPASDDQSGASATDEKHYQWPPVRDPALSFKSEARNPVHSILTALPVIMLVAGFMIYYLAESRQAKGVPILAESLQLSGTFTGLSATGDRHYLWIALEEGAKGVRVQSDKVALLDTMVRGDPIELHVAPRISGSTTYWAWRVEQNDTLFLEEVPQDDGDMPDVNADPG